MTAFDYNFTVDAPLGDVRDFYSDARVLQILTPLPIVAQIHRAEPVAEGSEAEFTLWFGPLPLRWKAVHTDIDAGGFTDIQAAGPLKAWRHTHRFSSLGEKKTLVSDHIDYTHDSGLRGLMSRLLFSRPALYTLFAARKIITRRHLETQTAFRDLPIA